LSLVNTNTVLSSTSAASSRDAIDATMSSTAMSDPSPSRYRFNDAACSCWVNGRECISRNQAGLSDRSSSKFLR
jgi:hypothetical protein